MTATEPAGLTYTGPHPQLFNRLPEEQQRQLLRVGDLIQRNDIRLNVTIGNLKGGVSKTTTTVYLALMLGILGDDVLVVDCDGTNRSAVKWSEAAGGEWPKNVVVKSWASSDDEEEEAEQPAARRRATAKVSQLITPTVMRRHVQAARPQFRHVLFDTAPERKRFLRAALAESNDFIITSSPYPMDTEQIKPSVDLAAEVEDIRGTPVYTTVLFSKAKKRTRSLREAGEDMDEMGVAYFKQTVTNLETYALAPSTVPDDFMEYVPVLAQLIEDQLEDDDESEEN